MQRAGTRGTASVLLTVPANMGGRAMMISLMIFALMIAVGVQITVGGRRVRTQSARS